MIIKVSGQSLKVPQIPRYFNGMWKANACLLYLQDKHPHLVRAYINKQRQGDASFHKGIVSMTKR